MKWGVFAVVLVAGLVNAGEPKRREALRRSTRSTISNMKDSLIRNMEAIIINSCLSNGLSLSGSVQLTDSFNSTMACVNKVRIYSIPQEEYLSHVMECSRDTFQKTRDCLPDDRQYFPDFIWDFVKSLVGFFYNHDGYQKNYEIVSCLNKMGDITVLMSYIKCIETVAGPTEDPFPASRDGLCQQYLPATACFPKTFKKFCSNKTKVTQFFDDYLVALSSPCATHVQLL